MTEKRFTIHNRGLQGQFIKESGEVLTVDMVCEMLNDFYEENKQLKQSLTNKMESDAYWEQKANERIQELEKENEQLKIDVMGQSEEIEILSDENKRLKQGKYIYEIHGGSNDRK